MSFYRYNITIFGLEIIMFKAYNLATREILHKTYINF